MLGRRGGQQGRHPKCRRGHMARQVGGCVLLDARGARPAWARGRCCSRRRLHERCAAAAQHVVEEQGLAEPFVCVFNYSGQPIFSGAADGHGELAAGPAGALAVRVQQGRCTVLPRLSQLQSKDSGPPAHRCCSLRRRLGGAHAAQRRGADLLAGGPAPRLLADRGHPGQRAGDGGSERSSPAPSSPPPAALLPQPAARAQLPAAAQVVLAPAALCRLMHAALPASCRGVALASPPESCLEGSTAALRAALARYAVLWAAGQGPACRVAEPPR